MPELVDTSADGASALPADAELVLFHDPAEEETVRSKLVPLFGERSVRCVADDPQARPAFPPGTYVVTYLDDEALGRLVLEACEHRWVLGFLPHPGLVQARRALGVPPLWQDAAADILQAQQPADLDVLTCNGSVVFDRVVIGEASSIGEGEVKTGTFARLRQMVDRVRMAPSLTPRPFSLETGTEKKLETAALAIIVVGREHRSVLTRAVVDDARPDDGMLHALVLAPRALMELVEVWLRSLLRPEARTRLPPFIGHIGTNSLRIRTPKAVAFTRDGRRSEADTVDLQILTRSLQAFPGRHLDLRGPAASEKEIFRVQGLPSGEARLALVDRPIPWRRHAATEEFRDLFHLLRDSARMSATFLTLMVLSSLLATFGLFAGSGPVIIGAMILAPLMAPIISLAMGVLRQHEPFITESLQTLAVGGLLAIGSAAVLTWLTPLSSVNAEIGARLNPTLLDLGVAVLSGVAGAYAHARAKVARSLAGVAIAVALVPPLAVAGIGLGWLEWAVFSGAFLLFLTNLAGIILAAALTFLWLGFSPFHRARRGLAVSLALVVMVSVPLALGFQRMVEEHKIIRALEGLEIDGVTLRDVSVRTGNPLQIRTTILSDAPVDGERMRQVKTAVSDRLGKPIRLEAVSAIVL